MPTEILLMSIRALIIELDGNYKTFRDTSNNNTIISIEISNLEQPKLNIVSNLYICIVLASTPPPTHTHTKNRIVLSCTF